MSRTAGELVGILLAGGCSRRFGADKLLHRLRDGTPMAIASARTLIAVCPHSVSVLRPQQTELRRLLTDTAVDVRLAPEAEAGMGSSLACAVRASADAEGWLVALADMPFLTAATLHSLLQALRNGADIVAPVYRGRRGHPVGFSRRWFAELACLQGDVGARRILDDHPRSVTLIALDDPGVQRDIDTPDDLRIE